MLNTFPLLKKIPKYTTPAFPQFIFEWHPEVGKVYLLEIPGTWEGSSFISSPTTFSLQGHCIAEHCEDHGKFYGFVQTYLRGYRKAMADSEKRNSNGR